MSTSNSSPSHLADTPVHPLALTSDEFADQMGKLCHKKPATAIALYQSFVRHGAIQTDLPEFLNAPRLFEQMVGLIDQHIDPVMQIHEEERTKKFLLRMADGEAIESVIMEMEARQSLCVSSQIGCRMGCAFCRTGQMGFRRNLTVQEIVEQVFCAIHILHIPIKNVVFMGMGEPLDTLDAVLQAVRVLTDPIGFGIGLRRITISTSGELAGILRLANEERPTPNLAVSLGAPTDEVRAKIMPRRRNEPLCLLKDALQTYCQRRQRQVLLSYVLLHGVNDSTEAADQLAAFAQGLDVRLNIIPYNEFPTSRFSRPPVDRIQAFIDRLRTYHLPVFVRQERGISIHAACGQLGGAS
jgi:23S rRNA (adenine2503-C2)-methyltransferase